MASTRNTIQKSMIMQALEILDHPSAEEVFRSVSEKYPSISKATVYRNLNQMAECGEILRLTITESADHYDLRCTPHYHAHCKSCEKIIDIFPEKEMVSKMLSDLREGKNIGVVSDAGYPGISDPGFIIAKEAIDAGYNVSCIGGPSAFIHGLVCSGLESAHFYFYGFLDSKQSARVKELETIKNIKDTIIFYETSNRMNDSLFDMKKVLGNRRFCIARELTKKYEEFIYGELDEIDGSNVDVKGECVVIVEGHKEENIELTSNVKEVIEEMLDNGISAKNVAKMLSRVTNISKNDLYDYIVKKDK